ncbi:MAG: lytic transglycosylase domain-containing protein [Candidatus Margulisiibacteriota bacterium]
MEAAAIAVILIFVASIVSTVSHKGADYREEKPSQVSSSIQYENLPAADFNQATEEQDRSAVSFYVIRRAKKLSRDDAETLVNSVMDYSKKYNVNPKLLTALIDRESGFDPMSVSSSNAQGLGQLLPATSASLGIRDPFNIDEGAKGAAIYTRMMLDRWAGNPNQVPLALASYTEGYNQVLRAGGEYTPATATYIKGILDVYNSIR